MFIYSYIHTYMSKKKVWLVFVLQCHFEESVFLFTKLEKLID